MTKQSTPDVDWFQLIVIDKSGLTGRSVVEFVSPLIRSLGISTIGISDLEGPIAELKDYEGRVVAAADFLEKAAQVIQFDWAFLFLYVKRPELAPAAISDDKESILQADLTVRLADDTYFYIYGRQRDLMDELRRRHPEAEFKISKFSELDIPY